MKRTEYFTFRPISDELLAPCIVVPKDYDTFPMNVKQGGSYNVAPARVLGLDYPTYLRFLRDSFPDAVTLVGKGHKYAHPIWKRGSRELGVFIKLLNDKMMLALEGKDA
jgi:hypothetical protein